MRRLLPLVAAATLLLAASCGKQPYQPAMSPEAEVAEIRKQVLTQPAIFGRVEYHPDDPELAAKLIDSAFRDGIDKQFFKSEQRRERTSKQSRNSVARACVVRVFLKRLPASAEDAKRYAHTLVRGFGDRCCDRKKAAQRSKRASRLTGSCPQLDRRATASLRIWAYVQVRSSSAATASGRSRNANSTTAANWLHGNWCAS